MEDQCELVLSLSLPAAPYGVRTLDKRIHIQYWILAVSWRVYMYFFKNLV